MGNLIAAPLQGRRRRRGATVFLDLATMEPHQDQWAYLSTLVRLTPRDVTRLARQLGEVRVGAAVSKIRPATSSAIRIPVPAAMRAHLNSRIAVISADLPPDLVATLKHAASMPNPFFTSGSGAAPPRGTFRGSSTPTSRQPAATWSCLAA